MKFEQEYLEKLAELMNENGLSEICVNDSGKKVILKKKVVSKKSFNAEKFEALQENNTDIKVEKTPSNLIPITSPMVGTFYASPSPDKEPYVKVGDVVQSGQTICIIEAMKLLNEIETDVSGKVVEICVENGQTIEFGQTLMYVE